MPSLAFLCFINLNVPNLGILIDCTFCNTQFCTFDMHVSFKHRIALDISHISQRICPHCHPSHNTELTFARRAGPIINLPSKCDSYEFGCFARARKAGPCYRASAGPRILALRDVNEISLMCIGNCLLSQLYIILYPLVEMQG